MRNLEIKGYGKSLPKNSIKFKNEKRYRISDDETQLNLAVEACKKALNQGKLKIEDIDCIVSASGVQIQPIPCTAAIIHSVIAKGLDIPALDINTTCTSFVTALDFVSYLIHSGRYKNVLIVSSDVSSLALNENQRESFELFGDGAAAFIVGETSNKNLGVIFSEQKTWSEGIDMAEIEGGLTKIHPKFYNEKTKEEYMFNMKGKEILKLTLKYVPDMFHNFFKKADISIDDIDMIVPHQASKAMLLVMKKLGAKKNKYINYISEYGNMVSASIPFTFCKALEEGKIKKGDKIILTGTAAGLTTNILYMQI